MKKIVLAAATLLLASGVAFAGSDHYGSGDNHASTYSTAGQSSMTSVDMTKTSSIGTTKSEPGYGQGIWGR